MDELSRNILRKSGRRLLLRGPPSASPSASPPASPVCFSDPHPDPSPGSLPRPPPRWPSVYSFARFSGLLSRWPSVRFSVCFSDRFSGPLLAGSPPTPSPASPTCFPAGPLSASLQPLYLRSSLSAVSCSGPCRRARPPVRAALIGPGLARRLVCSGPFLSERADGFRPSRGAFG